MGAYSQSGAGMSGSEIGIQCTGQCGVHPDRRLCRGSQSPRGSRPLQSRVLRVVPEGAPEPCIRGAELLTEGGGPEPAGLGSSLCYRTESPGSAKCAAFTWGKFGSVFSNLNPVPLPALLWQIRSPSQATLLLMGSRHSSCLSLSRGFQFLSPCRAVQTNFISCLLWEPGVTPPSWKKRGL